MTTYNTGNPIGSTDARDRLDNTENMDILENSTTLNEHPDRLGTMRKTRKGMELEHDNQMLSFERDFDSRLAGMAFTRVGTFAAGATLNDMRQTLLWEVSEGGDGHEYGWTGAFPKVVAAGATPATSGGIGAGAWIDRTDVTLRSDLNIVVKTFTSVADMIADATLVVGQIVETLAYHDGWLAAINPPEGGNKYEIVASGTGTDDGGAFINLTNSLQAKAVFPYGVKLGHFGANVDGVTDDKIYLQKAAAYVSSSNKKYLDLGGDVYISGLCDLSAYDNVTYRNGKIIGAEYNSTHPSSSIKVFGTLGNAVAYGTPILNGVKDFTVSNAFAEGDLILLSNFPTNATDAYTESAANVFGEKYRSYANTSASNKRQNRRKEPLRVRTSTGSAFSVIAPTAYVYSDTTALQFQKINAPKNIKFECDLKNIFLYFKYCDKPVFNGNLTRSFIASSGNYEPEFTCKNSESYNTDSRLDVFGATAYPKIRGKFSGMNGVADNALVKILGVISPDIDVSCNGSWSDSSFSHGVMLDTEYLEAADGYPSLPVVGGSVDITSVGLKGYSLFITCNPFASKVSGVFANVSDQEGAVTLKGASFCKVNGVCKDLSVIGCDNTDVTGLLRQTEYESLLTDERGAGNKYNTLTHGLWENFSPTITAIEGNGTINYISRRGKILLDGRTVTINGFIRWDSASGFTGSMRISGLGHSAAKPTAVAISEYGGIINTNGVTAKIDEGSQSIVIYYDGQNQQNVPADGYIGFSAVYEAALYEVIT